MNERMKNFYDQVGLDFENFQRVTVTKGDMEKFAELIVKECANWMEDEQNDAGDRIGDSFYWSDRLKQHFGVEE